jgi:hypothetical protein
LPFSSSEGAATKNDLSDETRLSCPQFTRELFFTARLAAATAGVRRQISKGRGKRVEWRHRTPPGLFWAINAPLFDYRTNYQWN